MPWPPEEDLSPHISMQTELYLVQRINNISRKEAHATLGISFITKGHFSATKYYGLLRFDVLRWENE